MGFSCGGRECLNGREGKGSSLGRCDSLVVGEFDVNRVSGVSVGGRGVVGC